MSCIYLHSQIRFLVHTYSLFIRAIALLLRLKRLLYGRRMICCMYCYPLVRHAPEIPLAWEGESSFNFLVITEYVALQAPDPEETR